MFPRLLSGFVALVLAGLAVGLPIVLTEAGTSKSTSESRQVSAHFEFLDFATGDRYDVYVSGAEETVTSTSSGGDSTGSKSNRPHGSRRANDQSIYSYSYADIQVIRTDEWGTPPQTFFGYAEDVSLTVADDLSSARLVAEIPVSPQINGDGTISVDLEWNATSPILESRTQDRWSTKSPRTRYHAMSTDALRVAPASGSMIVASMNLAARGSSDGYVSESASRSVFQY